MELCVERLLYFSDTWTIGAYERVRLEASEMFTIPWVVCVTNEQELRRRTETPQLKINVKKRKIEVTYWLVMSWGLKEGRNRRKLQYQCIVEIQCQVVVEIHCNLHVEPGIVESCSRPILRFDTDNDEYNKTFRFIETNVFILKTVLRFYRVV